MILTVEDLADFGISAYEPDALQILLDATEEMIVGYAGEPDEQVDVIDGAHRFLSLSRRATSITAVEELVGSSSTTLDSALYRLRPDGYLVERLTESGSLWWWGWRYPVTVTFVPEPDIASRQAVQLELVKLAIAENPGVTMEQVGAWLQQYGQGGLAKVERDSILSQLAGPPEMVVV